MSGPTCSKSRVVECNLTQPQCAGSLDATCGGHLISECDEPAAWKFTGDNVLQYACTNAAHKFAVFATHPRVVMTPYVPGGPSRPRRQRGPEVLLGAQVEWTTPAGRTRAGEVQVSVHGKVLVRSEGTTYHVLLDDLRVLTEPEDRERAVDLTLRSSPVLAATIPASIRKAHAAERARLRAVRR